MCSFSCLLSCKYNYTYNQLLNIQLEVNKMLPSVLFLGISNRVETLIEIKWYQENQECKNWKPWFIGLFASGLHECQLKISLILFWQTTEIALLYSHLHYIKLFLKKHYSSYSCYNKLKIMAESLKFCKENWSPLQFPQDYNPYLLLPTEYS